jgi:hypothetical protein
MYPRMYGCNVPQAVCLQYTPGCMVATYHMLYVCNDFTCTTGSTVVIFHMLYGFNIPQVVWVQYTTGCMGSTYHMLYMGSTYHMLYVGSDYALLILRLYCTTDCNYTSAVLNRMKNKSTKQPVYVTITHIC